MTISTLRYGGAILALAALFLFTANSSGPASNGNFFTGAPSAGGGMESTCSVCHRSGSFGEPQLTVNFALKDGGDAIPGVYSPGATYTVTVAVGHNDLVPASYGFQSQFITTGDTIVAAGTLANPDDDTQLTPGDGGRVYAEHNKRGPDSLFTFEWTAPIAGTDSVKMYVVGNLVNNAAGTGGDNGSTMPTIVTLAEGFPVSTREVATIPGSLFPNPTAGPVSLRVNPPAAGDYSLRLLSLDGRELARRELALPTGTTTLPLAEADGLPAGLYLVEFTGTGGRLVERLVKR
ncbi:MAG: choice-of-anchor V domain-containing protein [Bacteroidota bacterium]